jgi:hypothetical protein
VLLLLPLLLPVLLLIITTVQVAWLSKQMKIVQVMV